MNMKIRFTIIALTLSLFVVAYIPAIASDGREFGPQLIGENAIPYSGAGTAEDPNRYLIDETCKVTWKHVNEISAGGTTEIYEKRSGDTINGKLLYSWLFKPENLTDAYGPYFLGIYFYDGDITNGLPGGEGAKYFSISHKRHFPGVVIVTLDVSGSFSDGEHVSLTYYGGYVAEIVHGTSPIIAPGEIRDVDEETLIVSGLTVSNGYITFSIRHGGNYYILSDTPPEPPAAMPDNSVNVAPEASYDDAVTSTPQPALQPTPQPVSGEVPDSSSSTPDSIPITPDFAPTTPYSSPVEPIYAGEEPLGAIKDLFREPGIAAEIALQTGKTVDDTVSQGDLDSIQSLYLDSLGLADITSLLRQSFAYCSSLSLADNDLKTGGTLNMPMLERLDLSGNSFKSLNWLDGANSLKHLIIANNRFTELPLMPTLPSLTTLDLSYNMLTDVSGLAQPELIYVDLTGNPIGAVPMLPGCPKLDRVDITSAAPMSDAPALSGTVPSDAELAAVGALSDAALRGGVGEGVAAEKQNRDATTTIIILACVALLVIASATGVIIRKKKANET